MLYSIAWLKSYFVRDAFLDENQTKNSLFQPLSILEIEAVHKNKGTLENFKEIKNKYFQTIHSDIYKSTIVMFISGFIRSTKKKK
jgi:DNA repair protein RecO (recombination protein O)